MRYGTIRIAAICALAMAAGACGNDNPVPRLDGGPGIDAQVADGGPIGVDAQPGDDGGPIDEDGGPVDEDGGPVGEDGGPIILVDGGLPTDGGSPALCGDGVVSGTERCDPAIASGSPGACPTSCNDGIACTTDVLMGTASACDARCETMPVTACTAGDSCCPAGCATATDADCSCVPRTTCAAGECGTVDNGCGGALDCGMCPTGGGCDTDADCGTGVCVAETASGWPGGYCTRACTSTADCGSGSHCGYLDADGVGACIANCSTGADCRPGYSCRNADADVPATNECAPTASGTGVVGAPCTSVASCAGGDVGYCIVEAQGWQDGYCTRSCRSDTDCVGASHCGVRDEAGNGVCLADCTATSCRAAGYACWDADADTRSECAPSATGSGAVGAACDATFDCAGGTDGYCLTDPEFADGYCTVLDCALDTDCPGGSHCTRFGTAATGFCTSNCATDSNCRSPGYACWDPNEDGRNECYVAATGTGAVGSACELTNQCAGGPRGACIGEDQDFRGGYCVLTGCTAGGTGATGCPSGSRCSEYTTETGGTEGFCVDTCGADADCRADGYRCYDTGDLDSANECWVAGTGTGAVGAACTGTWQCGGGASGVCIPQGEDTAGNPVWVNGYCTRDCSVTACPGGSSCLMFSGGQELCLDNCTGTGMGDCRPTYLCEASGLGSNVCF